MYTHVLALDLTWKSVVLLTVFHTNCSLQGFVMKSFNTVNLLKIQWFVLSLAAFRSPKLVIVRAGQNAALNGSAALSL